MIITSGYFIVVWVGEPEWVCYLCRELWTV